MSVVSFARIAGVTWLSANSRCWIVSSSLALALINMISTSPCRATSRISCRYSSRVRKPASSACRSGLWPGADNPKAMSASLASAKIKSRHDESARMRAIFWSRDFCMRKGQGGVERSLESRAKSPEPEGAVRSYCSGFWESTRHYNSNGETQCGAGLASPVLCTANESAHGERISQNPKYEARNSRQIRNENCQNPKQC